MKINPIQCEVVDVKTETGICPGMAKTKLGEKFIIDGRTPDSPGMCSNAFCAISNTVYVMMASDSRPGEKDGNTCRVCPEGVVTFRLSRSKIDKPKPFSEK